MIIGRIEWALSTTSLTFLCSRPLFTSLCFLGSRGLSSSRTVQPALHRRHPDSWAPRFSTTPCKKMSSSSPSAPEVRAQKQSLRKYIRTKLRDVSREQIEMESALVWDRLFQLDAYQKASSVGLFLSMPDGEICTNAAIKDATRNGKDIYVPQVGKNFEQAEMELIKVPIEDDAAGTDTLFFHGWPHNKWGIPEPPPDMTLSPAKPGDIDVLVVPGLGFDRNGDRLGQGKGYYDRFIERMMKTTDDKQPPLLVAVGLSCQVVDSIPVQEYDRRMDIVLLPDETILVKKVG